MTSTHTFQGLDSDKSSSRVLKPPGGGSSCIFGSAEEVAPSTRQNKMASNIFGSKAEPENVPKRSNPPGGKTSGIFQDPAPSPASVAQRQNPPGGKTSDIFGEAQLTTSPKAHPNKPKDNISLKQPEVKPVTPVKAEQPPPPPPAPTPEPTPEVKTPVAKVEKVALPEVDMSKHEPHLGPKPRSHNRVLNPPGGKSSVTFY